MVFDRWSSLVVCLYLPTNPGPIGIEMSRHPPTSSRATTFGEPVLLDYKKARGLCLRYLGHACHSERTRAAQNVEQGVVSADKGAGRKAEED